MFRASNLEYIKPKRLTAKADPDDTVLKNQLCNFLTGSAAGGESSEGQEQRSNPQTLLFSATVPSWVHTTARKYMRQDVKKHDLVGALSAKTAKNVKVRR